VNSEIYHIGTRQQKNFHQPSANVTGYHKGVYYLAVKVFNKLPSYRKTESILKLLYKNFYIKFPSIPWRNTLNLTKVKYLHMIWIDRRKFRLCMFLFLIYQSVLKIWFCIQIDEYSIIICKVVKYFLFNKYLKWFLRTSLSYYILLYLL
jgi:hypothetical protein